ncbi:MAG: hypothetical protein ACLFR7_03710 [Opitutales bacterium]
MSGWLLAGLCCAPVSLVAQDAPLQTVDAILAAIWQANGGRERIDAVQSVYATGTLQRGEERLDLVILRKRPDLKRITVAMPGGAFHQGFDGQRSWQMQVRPDGEREVRPLEGPAKREFEADRHFLDVLLMVPEDGLEHRLEGVEYVGRAPAYVIETLLPEKRRLAYVDSRTLRILRFEEWPREGEGEVVTIEVSDYSRVDGVWFARRVERFRPGEETVVVQFDTIELNTGLFDTVFAYPEGD